MEPDDRGWIEATFRLTNPASAAADVLSLGPEIEVLGPPAFRDQVRDLAAATAALYDE